MAELFINMSQPVEGQPAPVSTLLTVRDGRAPFRAAGSFAAVLES
jgi:hypothetical protein